jgi:Family of unknown function (DUF6459)
LALTDVAVLDDTQDEGKRRQTQGLAMRMYTATEERRDPPSMVRLRPVPRCDPPFDDELPLDAAVSADQLTIPWPRAASGTSADALSEAAMPVALNPAATQGAPRAPGLTGAARLIATAAHDRSDSGAAGSTVRGVPDAGTAGDARLAVRRFVSVCVEVLNGYRPAAHLRRLSLPMEAPGVVAQGVVGARRVAELRHAARPADRRVRRPGPVAVLRVLLCEPRPGAIEAAVLLITGERTWAMAFRLELHQQKWAATALRLI